MPRSQGCVDVIILDANVENALCWMYIILCICPAVGQPVSEGYEIYCGLLRLYDRFSVQEDAAVPKFRYDYDHLGLRELRTRYRLDSVAGDGDVIERSLRLLDWLHRHVQHSNTDLDLEMNSLSLLEHAFDNGRSRASTAACSPRHLWRHASRWA